MPEPVNDNETVGLRVYCRSSVLSGTTAGMWSPLSIDPNGSPAPIREDTWVWGRARRGAVRGSGREGRHDLGLRNAPGRGEHRLRPVDPDLGRQCWRSGQPCDEALGMGGVGGGEHPSPRRDPLLGKPVVDLVGREQAEARVVMLGVVPRKEDVPEAARVLDRSE